VAEGLQRNRQVVNGLVRGVSDLYEGSKILIFLSWAPTGVQLAPTSPKLVEGKFCELRLYGVLRSSLPVATPKQSQQPAPRTVLPPLLLCDHSSTEALL
jgi:hypothetical protein